MNILTESDRLKLRVASRRLQDIFDRDRVSPIERGVFDYVIRAVIEALEIGHLFYEERLSPFVPPESDGETARWRVEINDEIKDLHDRINTLVTGG